MQTVINQYGNRLRLRVCGLCRQGDALLMVKHTGMLSESGIFWSPPGGGLAYGESVIEALEREFLEETNLTISVGNLLFVHEFLEPPLHAVELFFEVNIISGNLQTGYDPETTENIIESVQWLHFEEIIAIKNDELHQVFYNCTKLDDIFLRQGYFHLPNGSDNKVKNSKFAEKDISHEQLTMSSFTSEKNSQLITQSSTLEFTTMEQPEMLSEITSPNVHQSTTFATYNLKGNSLQWLWQEGLVTCSVINALGACEYLEEFSMMSSEDMLTKMQENIGQHEFLGKNVWKKITLSINNQSFTQIPSSIFRKEYTARYLQLAKGKLLEPSETLLTTAISEADLVNVFTVNKRLNDWLSDLYSFQDIEVKHLTSELIKESVQQSGLQAIIYFENGNFTLVISENGKLQFCNRFGFKTPQDLAYYLLFVMNELSILPSRIPLTIYGTIDETSEEYWEINKYFKDIHWGKAKNTRNFGGIMGHRFF